MNLTKGISLKQLITYNKNYVLLGIVLLIINKTAVMTMPYMSKLLIDDVIVNSDDLLLKKIVLIIALSLIIQAFTSFILFQLLNVKAQKRIAEIRTLFFKKITQLPIPYFNNSNSGALVSRTLNDFESIRIFIGTGIVQLIGAFISISFALTLMLYLNTELSLYLITPLSIFCFIIYFIYKTQKPAFKAKKVVRADVAANLTEAFRNIKVIKGFNGNEFSTQLMQGKFYALFLSIKSTITTTNLIISLGILFIGLTTIIVIWFGGNMAINQQISIGELSTFTIYLAFLIGPIYQITKVLTQFTDASASVDRINETLLQPNEPSNETGNSANTDETISFNDVSFTYDSKEVLTNASFELKPKTITAIVGKSGAGKTTLTDLLAAFYQPSSGSITIDSQNLNNINIEQYRAQLGFVFQETFLFNGTIKDNILLAKPEASEQEINSAIEHANVSEFLSDLPKGINTIIGEAGGKLSEGQKQRIAIARAFLKNPTILILDEATSNLDAHNEKLINQSIEKLMANRTILVIAHKLETITNANQIIVLDNGKIIEQGSHKELIENKANYYQLYHAHH